MAIPARDFNVEITITRPTRGYGNRDEGSTAIVAGLKAQRQPGQPSRGTRLDRASSGQVEETPDHTFYLDPFAEAVTVRVGDTLAWRELDANGVATGASYSGEIRRVGNWQGFRRGRLAHVALDVRGGDGSGA